MSTKTKLVSSEIKPPIIMEAEAELMRCAQGFALAFRNDKTWITDEGRLEYTIAAWKMLARAALAYAEAAKL